MNKKYLFKKSIALSVTLILFLSVLSPTYGRETAEKIYTGINNANAILNNIDYRDVKQTNVWSKEAICEVSALEIMKGYGNQTFGRTSPVTKEQALTLIYNAAGREAEAQVAAETLNAKRAADNRKTYAPAMWSDGYLQLAANDGLISAKDLEDALTADQSTLTEGSFYRSSAAQRQDVAFWIATVLGLPPVYSQQKIFNSYSDWSQADPYKIPYIEAVLQNNIMSGLGNGRFNPRGSVTREQMAQIIQNALSIILPLRGYERKLGTIESIESSIDFTDGQSITRNIYNVRNSNGKRHQIITEFIAGKSQQDLRNELNGSIKERENTDLIVYKDGWLGKSSILESGDRIEYTVTSEGKVAFVKVISNISETKYLVAKVNSINKANQTLNISKVFDLDYPNVDLEDKNFSFDGEGKDVNATFVYSSDVEVFVDNMKSAIDDIEPGMDVILSITDNMITGIKSVVLKLRDQGVASGIVEDNNPHLGYITLYNEKRLKDESEPNIKTYNYSNPKNITIIKNHKPASIEDIEGGDSVYIKFDDEGNIELISAVDNYVQKHGKVLSKKLTSLAIQYDDGTQQILAVSNDIPVILDKKMVDYDSIKEGDRVKLLLNITDSFTKLKQITIEGDEHFIAGIYKGVVDKLDEISNNLVVKNMEVLKNGKWQRVEQKGYSAIGLAEGNEIYYKNNNIDLDFVNKRLRGNQAYIAVEKDYGGEEKAILVSFKEKDDTELNELNDNILLNTMGSEGELVLKNGKNSIAYNKGTIIVKDKRLVTGSSISPEDTAHIIANREFDNGKYYANVVEITPGNDQNSIVIYRGRIANINENKDFTISAFSQLNGVNWDFYNTPKTFRITYDTRIIDDSGVVGQRNFTDYGESSFKDRTVYILAKGTDALLVNTVPYGNVSVKGEIYEIVGEEEPSELTVVNAKIYNSSTYMWENSKDMRLRILNNSIILKNNSIAEAKDIEKGDKVRIIKKDDSRTGDAYIIFVESN
ncbi:S-layer homology domain-containing protein [Acetivibrio clariflavus]|uniref:Putative S-layer protein n=1 Tax=Acetivibrio clariflavus (strain DSM 19732 / NBRC 101661 / EBR45) TaxID=720554 RepID=G8LTZ1_ACECE|nr:S-layer homology domain-containing protein [Acetivibrio clariflavus]AEV67337.1 putative S-layer protein [Acetivibrio clariflavus DSM 19732]